MARPAVAFVAALAVGFLNACSSGSFGQSGVSLPSAGDGVQTVSDAADALDAHRSSASESAKAAIGATDALGSFVRDISATEHVLNGSTPAQIRKVLSRAHGDKRVVSGSDVVMRPSLGNVTDFCQSSAGYTLTGIPSLDVTFGWQSGAFSGGTRATDYRGLATWSANASGEILQGAIGALAVRRSGGAASCPITAPTFSLEGADVANAFSIPISVTFHRGQLTNVSVPNASFANGESLDVSSMSNGRSVDIEGIVRNGRTKVATFRTNAFGNGTLTITSTGAQYRIANWIVVSI